MKLVVVKGIDATTVASAVGAQTYARGITYANQRAVQHMEWDSEDHVLRAVVRGSHGNYYETAVYFEPRRGAELTFAFGECTCPVGFDCKHVVAVAVTASSATGPAAGARPTAPLWEQSLAALLGPARPDPQHADDAIPLAIELSLSLPPSAMATRMPVAPKLLAVPNIHWWCSDMCFWPGSWELVESSLAFVKDLLGTKVAA